jgi:hypothetical protein
LSDLNNEELERWAIFNNYYKDKMLEYEKKWEAIVELDEYIESTLDLENHILIRDLTTPYEKLRALKQMLGKTRKREEIHRLEETHELENPILHCWILQLSSEVNIANNLADFTWERAALPTDQVMAGGTYVKVQAWGRATITVRGPRGPIRLTLHNVAYIPSFYTSWVSLSQGVALHFDSGQNLVYMDADRTPFCYTTRIGGNWIMMARDRDPEWAS